MSQRISAEPSDDDLRWAHWVWLDSRLLRIRGFFRFGGHPLEVNHLKIKTKATQGEADYWQDRINVVWEH